MLTRLQVHGFKNLLDVDIQFGPFTCIAGANGVGKSNLFDAIRFLSALADKPLDESAAIRAQGGQDVADLFHRAGEHKAEEMSFAAEMLIPEQGIDELGQETSATATFLRYELRLGRTRRGFEIREERLAPIDRNESDFPIAFPHHKSWRNSVIKGRRVSPYISTVKKNGVTFVYLHQDTEEGSPLEGHSRPHIAEKLPRTVLSSAANGAEAPTAVLARREMRSWRLLQLEPSALRAPDAYSAPDSIAPNGAHLPATLARLTRWNASADDGSRVGREAEAIYADIANRLAELIDGVHSIRVDADDARELLKLVLCDREGTEHEAKALSDGTLRFLALAILENDPKASGVLCLEEPENGIHPERIEAMLRLLEDLATDPETAVDEVNPLRQVIVNTHSPAVVSQIADGDLLVVVPELMMLSGRRSTRPIFRWLDQTWRSEARPSASPLPAGKILKYLTPLGLPQPSQDRPREDRRVIDRHEFLPLDSSAASG